MDRPGFVMKLRIAADPETQSKRNPGYALSLCANSWTSSPAWLDDTYLYSTENNSQNKEIQHKND